MGAHTRLLHPQLSFQADQPAEQGGQRQAQDALYGARSGHDAPPFCGLGRIVLPIPL